MKSSVLIYNARLLDEEIDFPGAILVLEGKIRAVFSGYFTNPETVSCLAKPILQEDGYDNSFLLQKFDARGLTLTPAFIDMHVHLRYPGQTQKEDLNSGLKAAASGGYGTVVAMPNTNPVVSDIELALKIEEEASKIGLTHLFQTMSITKDFDGKTISHLYDLDKKYVPVITEDGHDVLSSAVMLDAMKIAAQKNVIVSCHCEDPELCQKAKPYRSKALLMMKENGLNSWGTDGEKEDEVSEENLEKIANLLSEADDILYLAEDIATFRNIMLAKKAGCHVHLAHVSTENSINAIRQAKQEISEEENEKKADNLDDSYIEFLGEKKSYLENYSKEEDLEIQSSSLRAKNGFDVTCEVTPHHIALCGTESPFNRALVNPPLRTEYDRISLIEAIRDGTVDVISTDHAPHTIEDKENGSPGFSGLETAFGICNSILVKSNQISQKKLSKLMSANPARILGLQKGLLKPGYDADFTLIDCDEEWTVFSQDFYSKGKATPFEGRTLQGKVHALILDGRIVLER